VDAAEAAVAQFTTEALAAVGPAVAWVAAAGEAAAAAMVAAMVVAMAAEEEAEVVAVEESTTATRTTLAAALPMPALAPDAMLSAKDSSSLLSLYNLYYIKSVSKL